MTRFIQQQKMNIQKQTHLRSIPQAPCPDCDNKENRKTNRKKTKQ